MALWAPKCQRLGNSLARHIIALLFDAVNPRMKGLSNDRARDRALGDRLPPAAHAVKGGPQPHRGPFISTLDGGCGGLVLRPPLGGGRPKAGGGGRAERALTRPGARPPREGREPGSAGRDQEGHPAAAGPAAMGGEGRTGGAPGKPTQQNNILLGGVRPAQQNWLFC